MALNPRHLARAKAYTGGGKNENKSTLRFFFRVLTPSGLRSRFGDELQYLQGRSQRGLFFVVVFGYFPEISVFLGFLSIGKYRNFGKILKKK